MKIRSPKKLVAGAVAIASVVTLLPLAIAEDARAVIDGKTSATAAASCYEIKQNNPQSRSGTYWLYTPEMDAPEQFYCDQETNGGGWVMIGRGREGWVENDGGKGDPSQLHTNPDGTDAFTPVQLPSATVDALANGEAPRGWDPDGILVRRALNNAGTDIQNLTLKHDRIENWSWGLTAYAQWTNTKFDNPGQWWKYGIDQRVGYSKDRIAAANGHYNAAFFAPFDQNKRLLGFAYDVFVRGQDSASSYLYSPINGAHALPFSQVFIRPKLTQNNLNFGENLPDYGAAASNRAKLPESFSQKMKWRTSEATGTGTTSEMNTYVQAFGQVGNTVFIGGDFKNLVSAGGETVNQSFIAGFDVNSGELVRSFMPKLNGQVKSLMGLPDGKLAIGGEFTTVNGVDSPGFAVVDPVTGEVDTTRGWRVEGRGGSDVSQVKAMDIQNGYLYVAGRFTHVKGATSDAFAYARNAARFNLNTGSVDWQWRPNFNGTVNGISAAADEHAVYAGGYFSTNHGEDSNKLASIDYTTGKKLDGWKWEFSFDLFATKRTGFQFDMQDADHAVWSAGSEHIITQYQKRDYARLNSALTVEGGDFQDLHRDGDVIYGACHCGDWIYEGATKWKKESDQYDNVYGIKLVTAFDNKTGNVLPEFAPQLEGASRPRCVGAVRRLHRHPLGGGVTSTSHWATTVFRRP